MSFLDKTKDVLARIEKEQAELGVRIVDGHQVKRVVWETEKAIVFEDDQGHFWRFLHAYRQSWPVILIGRKESA